VSFRDDGVKAVAAIGTRFNEDDLLPALIFIVAAALACTTPAHNDTFWHLRSGQEMWENGSLLLTEPFSHTAFGQHLNNHWWLSQLVFYAIYSLGGPFLLAAFAGACAVTAIAGSWRLMRGPWELRVGLLAWLVVATAAEWAIRPQVISLVLLVLMAHLIARDRLGWLPVVCVVWANAHGLVIFGVAMSAAVLLESLIWSRPEVKRTMAVAAACAVAPMLSPLGWRYWPQVLTTVSISRELGIEEYQMPLRLADVQFWAGLGAGILLAIMQRHKLRELGRADRVLLIGGAILSVAAISAARNVAFFAVVAAPAFSRLWPAQSLSAKSRRLRPLGAAAVAMCLMAVAIGGVAIALRWRNSGADIGWQPMSSGAVEAVRRCPDPLFNHLMDGGFLMWKLPDRRVFVDSRMEAYPLGVLRASRQADVYGEYQTAFRDYRINCALVATASPLYAQLSRDRSMTATYSDSTRAVFVRAEPVRAPIATRR
jgi:hypothetical protein